MTAPGSEPDTSPDAVRETRFKKVRRGGYDPVQVREYLTAVAAAMEMTQASSQDLAPAPTVDPFTLLGQRAAEVMRAADEQARAMKREADERSRRQIDEAGRRATKMLAEAQVEAAHIRKRSGRLLDEVRTGAQEILAGEERVRAELRNVRESVLRSLGRLESTRALHLAPTPGNRPEEKDETPSAAETLFGLAEERRLDKGDVIDLPDGLLFEE